MYLNLLSILLLFFKINIIFFFAEIYNMVTF